MMATPPSLVVSFEMAAPLISGEASAEYQSLPFALVSIWQVIVGLLPPTAVVTACRASSSPRPSRSSKVAEVYQVVVVPLMDWSKTSPEKTIMALPSVKRRCRHGWRGPSSERAPMAVSGDVQLEAAFGAAAAEGAGLPTLVAPRALPCGATVPPKSMLARPSARCAWMGGTHTRRLSGPLANGVRA